MPSFFQVFLDKAFGFTIQSNTRISQSCDGTIAYLAGCVIVLYNCNDIQNQEFIISSAKKTLTCVAFSSDGRMIATGEVSKLCPKKNLNQFGKRFKSNALLKKCFFDSYAIEFFIIEILTKHAYSEFIKTVSVAFSFD